MGLSLTVSEINKQPNGLFVYEKATCGDCIWTSRTVMGRPIHCYKIVFGLVTLNMTDFFRVFAVYRHERTCIQTV